MSAGEQQPTIQGIARSLRDLLSHRRYGLEYYQREYGWKATQVEELMDDLTSAFFSQRELGQERADVAKFRPYFLGPIITSTREGVRYLIDGQQRMTTLSLLLIQILHSLESGNDQRGDVQSCVYSSQYGKKTFALDVPEREGCMRALLDARDFDPAGESESVRSLWARYHDLVGLFEIDEGDLPFFVDWFLEKVILVEITTTESKMAYEIFETMNDRGLSLTPTDMLKSYLLANVKDDQRIKSSDDFWRKRVTELGDTDKNADADFFKSWLRSSYADTIRARKRGAAPEDWDLIGTEFHKWVRDHEGRLGLKSPTDFDEFINEKFSRMSRHYLRMLRAQNTLTPDLEHVRYNAETGFTHQLTVALAPVTHEDDDATATEKMALVARYLDGLVARRMVNFTRFGYSTMQYAMFILSKDIRGLDLPALRDRLTERTQGLDETFNAVHDFRLHRRNGKHVRYLLARLTDFVERQCGNEPVFEQLVDRGRDHPYEIEHIWADKYERHQDEFGSVHDFDDARNRFGGLLLVPKSFNASYGALPYEEKVVHYRGQNHLLVKSLHPDTYERNPDFRRFIESPDVAFEPSGDNFSDADMQQRQALYRQLCELVWPLDAFQPHAASAG